MKHLLPIATILVTLILCPRAFAEDENALRTFFSEYCYDCHTGENPEAGLDLSKLKADLGDVATFAKWERIFDRVTLGEMPPDTVDPPEPKDREPFTKLLRTALTEAHAKSKGTVLRRLNRREYQNTLNDLFGTHLDLETMLPEDGRSHEFENIGEALGLSMVHLQRYMEAVGEVLDASIATTTQAEKPKTIEASYRNTSEAERFLGRVWKELPDGAIVRFGQIAYPSGMIRGSGVRESGRYRVRVIGYTYQSDEPIVFSVGGTSFARGSEKPIYGFFSFSSDKPTTVEFETWIENNYMIQIEPYGISDPDRYRRKTLEGYKGPGLAILKVILEGPLVDQFPSNGHRLVFDGLDRREIQPRNPADKKRRWYKPKFEIVTKDERESASQSLRRVAQVAFRRPVTTTEVEPYLSLFQKERTEGASFEEALRTAVVAVFCSPNFLYLQENPGKLDDHALAARLSYFLTRTTPDQELLELAAAGKLTDPATLRSQTERLLKDPRFERFLVDFTDAWLNLRDMNFTVPDGALFPEFDAYLHHSMPMETRAFVKELIDSNLPVRNLVQSDFAMLNSRLAEHYELPPVAGPDIRKVRLPEDSLRGGLLTQGSILKVTANGTNTSPVMRGVWVMERILGETPSPPPPGIPGVEPDIRGASTLRELLDKHRNIESCKTCHKKIDPPGFALESFNPIGGFRDRYRSLGKGDKVETMVLGKRVRYRLGPQVDSSGQLPDGRSFKGFREFRELLASQEDLLAKTLTKKLLTFATGRELGFSDRDAIERIVKTSAANGHGVRDLIHSIVQSELFQNK